MTGPHQTLNRNLRVRTTAELQMTSDMTAKMKIRTPSGVAARRHHQVATAPDHVEHTGVCGHDLQPFRDASNHALSTAVSSTERRA
jgi:hypothetical protein